MKEIKVECSSYFLLIADKRKLELAEKFKELKATGQLEKYLKRKGKKVASKERKKMPHRRVLEAWKDEYEFRKNPTMRKTADGKLLNCSFEKKKKKLKTLPSTIWKKQLGKLFHLNVYSWPVSSIGSLVRAICNWLYKGKDSSLPRSQETQEQELDTKKLSIMEWGYIDDHWFNEFPNVDRSWTKSCSTWMF